MPIGDVLRTGSAAWLRTLPSAGVVGFLLIGFAELVGPMTGLAIAINLGITFTLDIVAIAIALAWLREERLELRRVGEMVRRRGWTAVRVEILDVLISVGIATPILAIIVLSNPDADVSGLLLVAVVLLAAPWFVATSVSLAGDRSARAALATSWRWFWREPVVGFLVVLVPYVPTVVATATGATIAGPLGWAVLSATSCLGSALAAAAWHMAEPETGQPVDEPKPFAAAAG